MIIGSFRIDWSLLELRSDICKLSHKSASPWARRLERHIHFFIIDPTSLWVGVLPLPYPALEYPPLPHRLLQNKI